ncbi:NAD(+) diphosphatase [Jatrophihabitans endophyticus]|uniref:NAD(+) diphosphatase n=1 Tax=Jatrophihabitans endophyticus TaxID=1206085 RepID=UPI0019EB96E9|nr:NAD(+) diphosphatase [Jatrophihabitans endophyticus]MBE7188158.1 NAD(+) diphosphatase [Jatrophihabitans endophyticus]
MSGGAYAQPDGPPLARVSWDRAGLHRTDEAWLAEAWSRARVLLVSPQSATPVDADRQLASVAPQDAPDGPRRLLGVVDGEPWFTVPAEAPEGSDWLTLREIGAGLPDLAAGLVATAIGLEQWHQKNPRCPRCGHETVEQQAGWVRVCTVDGSHHFPRTDPAVIMLVHDGGDLALLGRNPNWPVGRFSTLAGFVEPGETLEAAVAREVFEEVGVAVRDVTYVASQPWPFPSSLMVGYSARLDGRPDLELDPVEMAEAGWFTRDEVRRAKDWTDTPHDGAEPGESRLRAIPPQFSISRFLIEQWLAAGD